VQIINACLVLYSLTKHKSLIGVQSLGIMRPSFNCKYPYSLQMIMLLIKKELDKYSADRLGKFDFALHSAGKIA